MLACPQGARAAPLRAAKQTAQALSTGTCSTDLWEGLRPVSETPLADCGRAALLVDPGLGSAAGGVGALAAVPRDGPAP